VTDAARIAISYYKCTMYLFWQHFQEAATDDVFTSILRAAVQTWTKKGSVWVPTTLLLPHTYGRLLQSGASVNPRVARFPLSKTCAEITCGCRNWLKRCLRIARRMVTKDFALRIADCATA
jgi:hypothetical protein